MMSNLCGIFRMMTNLVAADELEQLESVMRRARVYIRDGELRIVVLDRLLALHKLPASSRDLAMRVLERAGVRLVADPEPTPAPRPADRTSPTQNRHEPATRPIGDASAGGTTEPQDDASAEDVPGTSDADDQELAPFKLTEEVRASAIAAARQLLAEDRHRVKIAKRLLTAEEELGLSLLLRGEHPPEAPLPPSYRNQLTPGCEAQRAFDGMILHNQRLVWSVALQHVGHGLELEDLAQSGFIGLLRAVERFDPSRGLKFSTYATWWLRQSLARALDNESRTIRIPVHMHERIRRVMTVHRQLKEDFGEARIASIATRCDLTYAQVVECLRLSVGVVSLDAPVRSADGDGDTTVGDLLRLTPREDESDELIDYLALKADVAAELDALSDQEALTLCLRHGLWGDEPKTLDEIGKYVGVTRERIRQIESKAHAKLRASLLDRGYGPRELHRPWPLERCLEHAQELPLQSLVDLTARLLSGSDAVDFGVSIDEAGPRPRRVFTSRLAVLYGVCRFVWMSLGKDDVTAFLNLPVTGHAFTPRDKLIGVGKEESRAKAVPQILAAVEKYVDAKPVRTPSARSSA